MHAVPSPTRSSPRCNKNIVCKISHPSYNLDIKSVTISHVCMNIWLNKNAYVHTNNSPHHHLSFSIDAITNKITNTRHIWIHREYHNQLPYMYSPSISQSINIYVFANIDIIQQHHMISHNSSKGENTSHHDKNHIQHLSIIHTSSYNHIKLFIKDLQSIRP